MTLAVRDNNQLAERIERLADTLAHHNELTRQGFDEMNRRFALLTHQFDKRFEQIDKRFEQIDKRLDQVDRRFEQSDRRFESMQAQMDRRFDALTRRMDRFMIWSFSTTVATGGIVIGALHTWP